MMAGGKTILDHHLDRLLSAGLPVYVATTVNLSDDLIASLAARRHVPCYRGDERDVLSRYAGCAREHDLDTIVRVTSDCPLVDGELIAEAAREFVASKQPFAYLSNTIKRTYPRGLDFEVFSATALFDADANATIPADREHVTPYLVHNRSGRVAIRHFARSADASRYRLTLDEPADLDLLQVMIEDFNAAELDAERLIALLDGHPELVAVNAAVQQREAGQ
jgi:spore coat polysaccharide biosynthesis protein SpsF